MLFDPKKIASQKNIFFLFCEKKNEQDKHNLILKFKLNIHKNKNRKLLDNQTWKIFFFLIFDTYKKKKD